MKFLQIIFFLSISSYSFSQKITSFEIHFDTSIDLGNDMYVFFDNGVTSQEIQDSITDRTLNFSGEFFSKYAYVAVSIPRIDGNLPNYFQGFFINENQAKITFLKSKSENPLANYKLTGGKSADVMGFKEMNKYMKPVEDMFYSFYNDNKDLFPTSDSLVNKIFQLSDSLANKKVAYLENNGIKDYHSLWFFRNEIIGSQISINKLQALYNSIDKSITNADELNLINEKIKNSSLQIGSEAPSFEEIDIISNEAINLSDNSSKFILLNFWATWCAPCVANIPEVVKLKQKYSDKLEIIFISQDDEPKIVIDFMERRGWEWPINIMITEKMQVNYNVKSLPHYYLINPERKIIYNTKIDTSNESYIETMSKLIDGLD
jgi:thiol-disulfide isomerase/thioredoxin